MNSLTVVIPSKTASNLVPCIAAVRQHEPEARIIVVDDGLPDRSIIDAITIDGAKPFCFSRNVNLGIIAAGESDCLILNDDATLQTPNGFSAMQAMQFENPQYGIVSAVMRAVGNINQWPKGIGLREEPRMVCFVSVFIPRTTINQIGMLDEDFQCYSHQDDDYCVRVRRAGLRIGIFDGCLVEHGKLPSTFRSPGGPGGELATGAAIFKRKWGGDNRSV